MCEKFIVTTIFLGAALGSGVTPAHGSPQKSKGPVCSTGAICFSGDVTAGEEFHRAIDSQLELILSPQDVGWVIKIVPIHPEPNCDEFASVVNDPYRSHNDLEMDMSYGVTAEEEVSNSPRQFNFVTNCNDYRIESGRLEKVLWPYSYTDAEVEKAQNDLGSSPLGKGRLWIIRAKVSHASDTSENKSGSIEWMRFAVEIRLPAPSATSKSR